MLRVKCRCILLFAVICLVHSLPGESVIPESLVIGIARLDGKNISPAYDYLTQSIPGEILDYISFCNEHKLNPKEIRDLIDTTYREKKDSIRIEIGRLRGERDSLLFSGNRSEDKYNELSKKIDEQEFLLESFEPEVLPEGEISIPIVLAESNRTGELLKKISGDVENRNDGKLDYLVWGKLEEIEGLMYLYYEVYSFISGKSLFTRETVFLPENSDRVIRENRDELWNLFLGTDWSRLIVRVEPVVAGISLDRGEIQTGRLESGFISPGTHDLSISAYGYNTLEEAVSLSAGEERALDFRLDTLRSRRIPVESYPGGADIFLGSRWVGKTPLFLDISGDFTRILIRKEGYDDYSYFLEGDKTEGMSVLLNRSVFKWERYVESRRDRFYRSLGSFFLSIPVSVLLYSGYSVYSSAFLGEDTSTEITDEMRRLYDIGNLAYYGYIGSLYINTVLFLNVIFDAVDYVKTAGQKFKE